MNIISDLFFNFYYIIFLIVKTWKVLCNEKFHVIIYLEEKLFYYWKKKFLVNKIVKIKKIYT